MVQWAISGERRNTISCSRKFMVKYMTWFLRENTQLVIVLGISLKQYNLGPIESTSWFAINIIRLVPTIPNVRQYGMYIFVHFERIKSKVRLKVFIECTQSNQTLIWRICKIIIWSTFVFFMKNLLVHQYYLGRCK